MKGTRTGATRRERFTVKVTSAWIVDAGEDFPRLTSAYIKV